MKSQIHHLLLKFGYTSKWLPPRLANSSKGRLEIDFQHVAAHFMMQAENVYFIGIGANDGVTRDPLYPFILNHSWKGVMVEPVPLAFDLLQKNYVNIPHVKLVNAAVGESDGERTIYTIDPSCPKFNKLSFYSSFDRSILLRGSQWDSEIEKYITEMSVKTLSFQSLLHEAALPRVDVIKIDTEGYDLKILETIPLKEISPSIILAEHANLSRKDKVAMCDILLDHGYKVAMSNLDMLAYKAA